MPDEKFLLLLDKPRPILLNLLSNILYAPNVANLETEDLTEIYTIGPTITL